ncbi:hypothetical protein GCK32_007289 [Trichostrongylus colubriformis]|uniref:Protein kinase domain-containing protein n=1 Tax=Trichostrongylus colubriformis TaxID=6319 RepID=A0AAN8EZ45_TRICO
MFHVVDRTGQRCLRLLLSKHQQLSTGIAEHHPDPSGTYTGNIVEVPYSQNCSSCGTSRVSLAKSAGDSSCSSGVQWDIDERKLSAQSPRAPVHWKEAKCIGSGAFGSVYLAYDVDTGRDLAVKKIPIIPDNREFSRDAQGLEFDVQELANILRDSMGNVKIADFGSGKKMQSLASQQGAFHSTIHYTAPEADVWSVGVTLVEMLTGQVPWKEFEPMAAMFQIAYEEPRIDLPPTVQPVTADLCKVLMNKNFEERPMAAEVLLNHSAFKSKT